MIMKLNLAVSYKSWWMLMKKMMRYKDFYWTIEYFLDDNIFYGKVIGINGLISYEGKILEELIKDFNEIVY